MRLSVIVADNLFYIVKLYIDGENVDIHTIKGCVINLSFSRSCQNLIIYAKIIAKYLHIIYIGDVDKNRSGREPQPYKCG